MSHRVAVPCRVLLCLAVLVASHVVSGCGSRRYYQPRTEAIAQRGAGEAVALLQDVLSHARDPAIADVQVTVAEVIFACERVPITDFPRNSDRSAIGFFSCPGSLTKLTFTKVETIDMFPSDGYLILRGPRRRTLFTVKTRTEGELYTLVDLWMWFRDQAAHKTATAVTPLVVEEKRSTAASRRLPSHE